jgi:hypothetical protein
LEDAGQLDQIPKINSFARKRDLTRLLMGRKVVSGIRRVAS